MYGVKQTKQTKVKRLSIDRLGAVLQLREEKEENSDKSRIYKTKAK